MKKVLLGLMIVSMIVFLMGCGDDEDRITVSKDDDTKKEDVSSNPNQNDEPILEDDKDDEPNVQEGYTPETMVEAFLKSVTSKDVNEMLMLTYPNTFKSDYEIGIPETYECENHLFKDVSLYSDCTLSFMYYQERDVDFEDVDYEGPIVYITDEGVIKKIEGEYKSRFGIEISVQEVCVVAYYAMWEFDNEGEHIEHKDDQAIVCIKVDGKWYLSNYRV